MANKQIPSKRKLLSIQEDKVTRQIDNESALNTTAAPRVPAKKLLLDLEIFRKDRPQRQGQVSSSSQRVLVSIKPRAPTIKTIYIAEKSRFSSGKGSEKSSSQSRLGIGDHSSLNSSFITYLSKSTTLVSASNCDLKPTTISAVETGQISSTTDLNKSVNVSFCTETDYSAEVVPIYKDKKRPPEKCFMFTQPQFTIPKVVVKAEKSESESEKPNKVDIGTLIITNTSSDETLPVNFKTIKKLSKRIDQLEQKLKKQEMVFRSLDPNLDESASDDEESKESSAVMPSGSGRPGCSYIQQYSHIPETSAFQRYAQQSSHVSASKATTLEKEHNSEQYGRDFTTYDGITARGRRQCASVPCKQEDFPKMAAERVHKIRHKLNPVRDYRLMDTVHYLAQGEFAPRDDGIKLTPSREAVLSDIIWEDVCRTHWPNARLGRRNVQPERCSTRCELQRLIDSLLRERVAHVERRRRRHYRIVKLNHRHESCRPAVGKTGDIIVASHKKKDAADDRQSLISDHNTASATMSDRRWEDRKSSRKGHRSHDRLVYKDLRQKRRFQEDECAPGTSYAASQGSRCREPTCCYHSSSPTKPTCSLAAGTAAGGSGARGAQHSSTSNTSRNPRLVVKKDTSHSKRYKEEPNLEQLILLPTLVIRTPSNVKRQKKFNELYHRILNVQKSRDPDCVPHTESNTSPTKKDIGFNINVSVWPSDEDIHKK